ncbi:hypothetical protein EBX93_15725, partial [bacterium]|nr:hypothetical protein [bacterium]
MFIEKLSHKLVDIQSNNWNNYISVLRKIKRINNLSVTDWCYYDVCVDELAISATICSYDYDYNLLLPYIDTELHAKKIYQCSNEEKVYSTKLIVNGQWIRLIDPKDSYDFVSKLRLFKRTGIIPNYTTIIHFLEYNEIHIYTDKGRVVRPVWALPVNNNNKNININQNNDKVHQIDQVYPDTASLSTKQTYEYLKKKCPPIEFIDMIEQRYALIAPDIRDIKSNHNYCEIHANIAIYGVISNQLLYSNHNPFKVNQSIANNIPHTNCITQSYINSSLSLIAGQKNIVDSSFPLVQPNGMNLFVAIIATDGIIMNESAIKRGALRIVNGDIYAGCTVISRCTPKQVISRILNEVDMPFNDHGLRPDIIIGFHTVGQLMEMHLSKMDLLYGIMSEESYDYNVISHYLHLIGLNPSGNEIFYNADDGKQLDSVIYTGFTYFMPCVTVKQEDIITFSKQSLPDEDLLAKGMTYNIVDDLEKFQLAICNQSGCISSYNPNSGSGSGSGS